jgi:hypothetical protein
MTINQIIGNRKTESKINTELWKKLNEKYSENTSLNKPITNNIEQKLTYINEIPKLSLTPLDNTVVNTITQKEYDNLMQIYDAGEWKLVGSESNIMMRNYWDFRRETTCIEAGINDITPTKTRLGFDPKEVYIKNNQTILSFDEFCKIEEITREIITELNNYYNKNYPNRKSRR